MTEIIDPSYDNSMPDNPDDALETADDFEAEVLSRLEVIQQTQIANTAILDGLRVGVNTIGEMMNNVVDMFGQISEQVQKGGLSSLLGGLMGGNKNGG